MLEGNPGCTECKKPCQYNGLSVAAWKIEQRNKQYRYGCNSSVNKFEIELERLIHDSSASHGEIAEIDALRTRRNLELLKLKGVL